METEFSLEELSAQSYESEHDGAAARVSSHDDIAHLAYLLWEARSGADGSAEDDWFNAERRLRHRGIA